MESFCNALAKSVVMDLTAAIRDNKEELSRIDGLIGDGDHGINMGKGFQICAQRLDGTQASFSEALDVLGNILVSEIGGSMGPVYGNMFINMAEAVENTETIDKMAFAGMMDAAVEGIRELSDAAVGDKTMIDVLIPSQKTIHEAVAGGKTFNEVLDCMQAAATQGRDSTIDMVAKIGRASRLGERSRGVMDVGAASCCLILCTMAESMKKLLNP